MTLVSLQNSKNVNVCVSYGKNLCVCVCERVFFWIIYPVVWSWSILARKLLRPHFLQNSTKHKLVFPPAQEMTQGPKK